MSNEIEVTDATPVEGTSVERATSDSPVEQVEAVRVRPKSDESLTNAVDVNLKTDTMDFQIRTQTSMTVEAVDLAARLETAMILLRETTSKLENALYRIGFLEGQLALLQSQKAAKGEESE